MEDNGQKHIYDKTRISTKVYFIIKHIFYGILFTSYWYMILKVAHKGISGSILALVMAIMVFYYRDIIDPIKENKNELGKYTNIITRIIEIIIITCLWFYIW